MLISRGVDHWEAFQKVADCDDLLVHTFVSQCSLSNKRCSKNFIGRAIDLVFCMNGALYIRENIFVL